ncbi:hypothetical protein NQ317_016142 [Molorchus minor]|uniref:Protein argonaute N-terminal domain-containing protein n=1 Tax=Molorchus minor TaxID=1323400 RepID=A0ABQ9IYN5_9CUCU|nr:hypothetical protein NQ317_016142 [Molorchus minor]
MGLILKSTIRPGNNKAKLQGYKTNFVEDSIDNTIIMDLILELLTVLPPPFSWCPFLSSLIAVLRLGKKESTGAPLEQQSSGGQRTATQPQGGSQPTPQSGPARQQGGKGRGKGRGDSQSQSSQKHVNVPSGPGVSDQSQFPTQTSQPDNLANVQPAWGQPQPTIQPPSAWSPPQQVLGQLPQNVNQPPPAKGQQPQQPQYPYQQAQQAGATDPLAPGIPQIRQPQQQQPAGETPVSKQQPQKGPEVGGGGDQPSSHTPGSLQRESPRQLSQQGDQTKSITPTQQPQKGQQKGKGKQKGQPQGGGGGDQTVWDITRKEKEGASTSQISSTSTELSKIKISDKSQGGTDILPMKYIRAKPGTKGRKIPIEVNHLALNLGKLKTAIHYDVNLIPDIPKKYLRDVLERFRQIHYNNRYPAFDGRKNLYSSSPLPFGDYIEDEIVIREPDGREKNLR